MSWLTWMLLLLERSLLRTKDRIVSILSLLFGLTCSFVAFFSPIRNAQRPLGIIRTHGQKKTATISFSDDVHVAEYDKSDGIFAFASEAMKPGMLPAYRFPICGPQEVERQELLARFVVCNHMINYWERRFMDETSTGFFSGRLGVLGVDPENWVIVDHAAAMDSIPEIAEEIVLRDRHALLRKTLKQWPRPSAGTVRLKQVQRWLDLATDICKQQLAKLMGESKASAMLTAELPQLSAAQRTDSRGKVKRKGSGKKGREPARLRAG